MTPRSLSITFNCSSRDSSLGKYSNQNETGVSAAESLSVKEHISVRILPKHHPLFDTPIDPKMTTILEHAKTNTMHIHHKGQKEGVRIKLPDAATVMENMSSHGNNQTGYIITPSGANVGENISINGGGLIIRAKNDKSQTITAKSTPDNQIRVQVGQGKSAVQLSIQVTPQGTRGEVELKCVRNAEQKGGTMGYTVNVKRPKEDSQAHEHQVVNSQERNKSPSERSAYLPQRSKRSHERGESSPERGKSPTKRPGCSSEQSKNLPQRCRSNFVASREYNRISSEMEVHDLKDEVPLTFYPNERSKSNQDRTRRNEQVRVQNSSPMQLLNQPSKPEEYTEENIDLHYKRKLDTHHHKPTISYLIARRMTELFKEMRKTAEMHRPPPFIKF